MIFRFYFVIMMVFLLGSLSIAADLKKLPCSELVTPRVSIIPSGRNSSEVLAQYKEVLDFLFEKDGLLDRFEIELPPQVMKFVAGREMDALAGLGRHPVGHWHDGAEVVQMLSGWGGIYEFVAAQDTCQVAVYRDTLDLLKNISIIFHVVGHHIFERHSRFPQVREVDHFAVSMELYRLLETLYQSEDHDEVSQWYQWLLTLAHSQDKSRGSFDPPEQFDPRKQSVSGKHPAAPSASVLQAYVANMPAGLPEWKVRVAVLFEMLYRHYSGRVPTKIMNEGFATLLQELLPEHTPYATLTHVLAYGDLLKGIISYDLRNPYYLGRECWRRIRARFNDRPETQRLSPFERDKRFLHYAIAEIISKFDDFEFLRFGLDAKWVHDENLALTRRLPRHEWDYRLEVPPDLENPEQRVIVSRDATEIIHNIARSIGQKWSFPRDHLIDFNLDRRAILLGFTDEFGKNLPLKRTPMIATLLIHARVMQKTIALETVASTSWLQVTVSDPPIFWHYWPPPWFKPKLEFFPIRVEVSPSGKVVVYDLRSGAEVIHEELTQQFQRRLDGFKAYQDIGINNNDLKLSHESHAEALVASSIASHSADSVPMGILMGAPTAPRAIIEFSNIVSVRLADALRRALNGKAPLIRGGAGVAIKVLPMIPQFTFDERVLKRLFEDEVDGPVFSNLSLAQSRLAPFIPEDKYDVDKRPGKPGDKYWDSGGTGDGEGEGDDDDEGDGDPSHRPGKKPGRGMKGGEGSLDPTFLEIPLDMYSRILNELIQLPNLRPKKGLAKTLSEERSGARVGRDGVRVNDRIRKKAYALGRAHLLSQGKLKEASEVRTCILEGLKRLRSKDIIIKSHEPAREPEISAQVTFLVDASGSMLSMMGLVKNMVYDIRALLMQRYKKIEFRFVMFDSSGHVFNTWEDFARASLGGGTDYKAGFEKTLEVQEAFPSVKWDRFVIGFGDLEDFTDPAITLDVARTVMNQSEYFAMAQTGEGDLPLGRAFASIARDEPWVGFVQIPDESYYTPEALKKLFKNE